jgi:transcriptional regulator with XRE-family HTH domain
VSDQPNFAERLRQLRAAAGLTQEQLAERAGLSVAAIGDLERGRVQRPQAKTVRALAKALRVPAYELDAAARRPRETEPRAEDRPRVSRPARAAGRLDGVADLLAALVGEQWRAEAEVRRLGDPRPLAVRWAPASPELADAEAAAGDAGPTGGLARTFRELPHQRLVVLGPAGAGKTGLLVLLLLGLLGDRRPADPVPVLLSLSSWNPARERLVAWLRRRLLEDYPRLRELGAGVADDLVAGGRVLPLLDGLDELPEPVRERSLEHIRLTGRTWPLVVACRTGEYGRAVAAEGPLRGAAAVELQPVEAEAAIEYLGQGGDAGRWEAVFAELRQCPESPLAQALSTPLMVSLAGAVYGRAAAEPRELLDAKSRQAVEDRLFDGLIPAALEADRLRREDVDDRWSVAQAQRWLAFLARALRGRGTRDLAWWELWQSKRSGLLIGAGFAAAFLVVAWRLPGGSSNLGLVVEWACCFGIFAALPGKRPAHSVLKVDRLFFERLRGVAMEGLRTAANIGLVALAIVGLIAGVLSGLAQGPWAGLSAALRYGLVAGAAFGLSWASGGVALGVLQGLVRESGEPPSPASSLRSDRAGLFAIAMMAGPIAAALVAPFGLVLWLAPALGTGVRLGSAVLPLRSAIPYALLGAACLLIVASPWLMFQATRLVLAIAGRLPLRLMTFLDDVHRAGILRQVGAVYQFRHAELQDRLAGGGVVGVESGWRPLRCAGCRKTLAPWAGTCPRCGAESADPRRAPRPERLPDAAGWLLVGAWWAFWWYVGHPALERALRGWFAPAILAIVFLVVYSAVAVAIFLVRPGVSASGPVWVIGLAGGLIAAVLAGLVMARRRD